METTEEAGITTGGEAARRRRQRIAERGSDRMALITGRIQTLPPPPNSPSSSLSSTKHLHTQSSPALLFQDQTFPQPPLTSSDQIHVVNKSEEDDGSGTSAKHDLSNKLSRGNAFNFRGKGEPQLSKCETNIGATQAPEVEAKNEEQPLHVTPKAPKTSVEIIRVFCAVIIALLVVLSNINLPRNIVKSRSTIASQPLYILLLTDVTIVVVRLLEKRRSFDKAEEGEKREIHGNWMGAFKILEIGLVFYQIIRALFIDCSFYMVVVICGLSLV
ncbi:hypothetical protein Vadar_022359 [Vaccinium darrowii]|uniref:Uncharacterized protein n=1 Tax=Vaccinium darrowii TaxID=229202 RepID=A0ACB7ZM80_9ERIC|nr:hypothetical protein Vadar_022359 [Vaccinium darrowii]